MNVSASGLSKILLQVIPRDFSKFSPEKILRFFQRSRSPLSHPLSVAAQAEMAGATYSGQSTALVFGVSGTTGTALVKFTTKARLPKWHRLLTQVYIVRQDADAAR